MKKIKLLAIVTGCILISATICAAQTDQTQTGQMGHMTGKKMKKGDQMQRRCPMGMGMGMGMGEDKMPMCGMMGKTMVPSDDGGVIVMIGNKLYKYDKNLELKKETELTIDYENMKKMMMKMHDDSDMTGSMPGSQENTDTNQ